MMNHIIEKTSKSSTPSKKVVFWVQHKEKIGDRIRITLEPIIKETKKNFNKKQYNQQYLSLDDQIVLFQKDKMTYRELFNNYSLEELTLLSDKIKGGLGDTKERCIISIQEYDRRYDYITKAKELPLGGIRSYGYDVTAHHEKLELLHKYIIILSTLCRLKRTLQKDKIDQKDITEVSFVEISKIDKIK